MKTRPIWRRLVNYFLKGLLITAPISLTVALLYWIIDKIDKYVNMGAPLLSLLVVVASITVIGFVGSGIVIKPFLDLLDDLLEKIPGFKHIYSPIKEFLEAFVGENKKFTEPVAVEMSPGGILKLGFVTEKDLSQIELEDYVAVYFPHSYNFSGNLFLVPKEKVKPLKANSADLMKFIVSGGVTNI